MNNEWNDLCNHCGDCCNLFNSGTACPIYNVEENRCNHYKIRKELNPNCTKLTKDNVLVLHEKGVLSDRCNYVRHMKGQELIWNVDTNLKEFSKSKIEFKMVYYASRRY